MADLEHSQNLKKKKLNSQDHLQSQTPLLLTDGSGASSSDALIEVDDEVVREIDVVFNPSLGQNAELCIMQYPLRPVWRPYELSSRCTEVRKNDEQVEVDLSVDVDSEHYDKYADESLRIHKQTLSSSVSPSLSNCAVGLLIKDQLHLNLLHTVLQFRSSLKHLNDGDVQEKPKSVKVETKSAKGKSVLEDAKENKVRTEPWVLLEYNSVDSTSSAMYRKKLLGRQDNNIPFMMKQSDYVTSLCRKTSTVRKMAKGPSKRFVPHEPLEERLIEWIKRRQVNRFDALIHLDYTTLDTADAKEKFLKLLQRYAYLVQGVWVCKSNLLYEGREAIQRDCVLFMFSKNHVITDAKLKELRLDTDSAGTVSMLRPLASRRSVFNDWKFREKLDLSFVQRYPSVVLEQESGWLNRHVDLIDSLHKSLKKRTIASRVPSKAEMDEERSGGSKVVTSSVTSNDKKGSLAVMSISKEARDALIQGIFHIFADWKARSMITIRRELHHLALSITSRQRKFPKSKGLVDAVASASNAPPEAFQSVVDEVAIEIHNLYVLKQGENPALDPVRNVIIKLFQDKEPNAKLGKQEIKDAVQNQLKKEISDDEYNQVLRGLCVSVNGAWLLKQADK